MAWMENVGLQLNERTLGRGYLIRNRLYNLSATVRKITKANLGVFCLPAHAERVSQLTIRTIKLPFIKHTS